MTDELDLLRALRGDVPPPSQARLVAGRRRLLASIERPPARRARARVVLAAAVALAAVAAGVGLTAGSRRGVTSRAVPAARVLNAAADMAAARPVTVPAPGQWIFTQFFERGPGKGLSVSDNWIRFDGRQSAYFQGGRLVVHTSPAPPHGRGAIGAYFANITPLTAYQALRSLPAAPRAMLAAVARVAEANANEIAMPGGSPAPGRSRAQLEFAFLSSLLWNSWVVPSRAQATAFRAMAVIPGVTVQRGITSPIGQPAIGVADRGAGFQLLLDSRSYQVIGLRTTGRSACKPPKAVLGGSERKQKQWCDSHTRLVVTSMAERAVPVARPGER